MTGTVARGGWGTSAGRVRGWGRDGKREGRTREVRTRTRRTVRTRARETPRADVPRAVRARPVSRHFDVVKSMGAKRDRVARASAEARGRNAARLPASDARRGHREGGEARDDGLAGRRAERARPPRPPRAARGKGGKARMMAARKAADLGSRRVPSPFETCALRRRALSLLRSRKRALALLSGSLARVLRARGVTLRARGSRERVSFSPTRKSTPDLRGLPFGNIAADRRFAVAFDATFDRRTATATVRGSVSSARWETSRVGSGTVFNPGFRMIDRALFAFESIRARGLGEIDPGAEFSVTSDRRAVMKIQPRCFGLKKTFPDEGFAFLTPYLRDRRNRAHTSRWARQSRLSRAILIRDSRFSIRFRIAGQIDREGRSAHLPTDGHRSNARLSRARTEAARFAAHAPAPVSFCGTT